MPDVWRVKPGAPSKDSVPTWDVFCGTVHYGTEFESLEEADDFVREHVDVGWTEQWPIAEGWYWFWDPRFPDTVEPGRMQFGGNDKPLYTRAGEVVYERHFPDCQWYLMEKPPAPPKE